MELEHVALVADVVQAIAVVATLIFVGLQVQHNTRIARMTAAQNSVALLAQNMGRVTESPDLARLLSGESGEFESLSEAERLRVSNFIATAFRHLEVLHAHRRYDIYEEELWHGAANRLRNMLENPRIRAWWDGVQESYASSFQAFVTAEIETIKQSEAAD